MKQTINVSLQDDDVELLKEALMLPESKHRISVVIRNALRAYMRSDRKNHVRFFFRHNGLIYSAPVTNGKVAKMGDLWCPHETIHVSCNEIHRFLRSLNWPIVIAYGIDSTILEDLESQIEKDSSPPNVVYATINVPALEGGKP